jgi:hypothetical protein
MENLFEIKSLLGSGFSSNVYCAEKLTEPCLRQSFAIKKVALEYSDQAVNEISVSLTFFISIFVY